MRETVELCVSYFSAIFAKFAAVWPVLEEYFGEIFFFCTFAEYLVNAFFYALDE